ncbi:MAG TPA: type II toxin-antitoxin system HicB family antitoxin [Candidatus Acidoferrum sp.]|jgi:predicted RNase H-like HicB family nuclease|nr:type II toxin-antitoxin system HicB family antitoxin [Candidatus Acidoferrum sp.]
MDYIAYLHKESKSDFGVSFPDFPGCITAGKSLDEARRKAPEALAFHIAGMREDGEKIPKPSKLDDLTGDPNRQNAVAFLVTTDFPKSRTVRVNVTARENQIELIDRLARQAGMTRSAYMVQSATSGVVHKKRDGSRRRLISVFSKQAKPSRTKG